MIRPTVHIFAQTDDIICSGCLSPLICAFFGMQNLLLICPNHIGEFTAASQCVNGAIFSGLCPTYIWIYLKRPCFLESARTKIST